MIPDVLTLLEQTTSAEERTWILTDAYLKVLPPDVAEAARAAAVPHWFDVPALAALLQTDAANAERLYQQLQTLSFVESFGDLGHNVHDLTRAGVLAQYFVKIQSELFKTYNQRAQAYFKQFDDPQHVVEAVYHLLITDRPVGIKLFTDRMKDYRDERNYSAANNLLRNAQELVKLGTLTGEDVAEVERQEYYLADALSKSGKPEELAQAAKMFRPDEDISRYQEPNQLREFVKHSKRDFLTQRIDEARQMGDSSRQKIWLREWGEISRLEDHDYETALQRYNAALVLDPNDTKALALRGEAYRMMGKYDDAVADLTRAIELDPKSAWALANRGVTYGQMERYDDAVADLTRAIELDPKSAWALANRGVTYRQMERYDDAVADLTLVIELNPKFAGGLAVRGKIYWQMGQYAAAVADLTRAIELAPKDAWALAIRGDAYRMMGKYDAAVADLTHAIELEPNVAWVLAVCGETYRQMGQYEVAVADLTRAIELEPNVAGVLAVRGNTYRLMGRYDDAVADLTRAIELNPKYARALAHRGETYWHKGQYAAAVADVTRGIIVSMADLVSTINTRSSWLLRSTSKHLWGKLKALWKHFRL
jgi:tetratricopeptide (TPR) repeat protein